MVTARAAPWRRCQNAGDMAATAIIDEVLDAFLSDQRARLSARTMRNYEDVVDLLLDSLNGYGPNTLESADHRRWEQAFHAGDMEAFCHLFGPEHILGHVDEFLGYFMIRKVMAGQELMRAAGTVTKRLARWLHERGYVDDSQRDLALDRGTDAARDLPRAERLAKLLYQQSRRTPSFDWDALAPGDLLEDQLVITRVEDSSLHFTGLLTAADSVGPVKVDQKAAALAQVGWRVTLALARLRGTWKIVEVGSVYPG